MAEKPEETGTENDLSEEDEESGEVVEQPEEVDSDESEDTESAEGTEEEMTSESGSEEMKDLESAMTESDQPDEEDEPDPPVIKHEGEFYGTGRRKTSVARVWIQAGQGDIIVNGQDADQYFQNRARWLNEFRGPLEVLGFESEIDVRATLEGGGKTGQSGALQLGIARALVEMDENTRRFLRPPGYLTRDDRQVERKKMNQPGARAKSQVSKR